MAVMNGSKRFNILDKSDKSLAPVPSKNGDKPLMSLKRQKFGWSEGGDIGEFKMIDKHDLNIDERYQRDMVSESKVREIASSWDWLLFGALSVIQRQDGSYWVFDGGHRTRASFYRDDIAQLPCMVHKVYELRSEAKAFKLRNTMISNVAAFDRFRADLCAEDPVAIQLASMLDDFGLTPMPGGAFKPSQICCISTLLRIVSTDADTARRALEFALLIADEKPVASKPLAGLFILQRHFAGKLDILAKYEEKLSKHSLREIEIRINQFAAEAGKGGETVSAKAILSIINKKLKNKLEW